MEKLPNESLELIFHLLSLQNKLECTLVCRWWANVLHSGCLLHTVNIVKMRVFKQFISHMEANEAKNKQVERLILHDCIPSNFDTRKLITLFPRLCVLLMKPGIQLQKLDRSSNTLVGSLLSNYRLEHLMDFGRFELTLQLLTQGFCPTLRTLELTKPVLVYYGNSYIPFFESIRCLIKLKMWDGHFTMQNIEDIHSKLPLLETLEVSEMAQIMFDIPRNIEPVPSVKSLTINLGEGGNNISKIRWLQYIRKKYPSLQHFISHINAADNEELYNELEVFLQYYGPQLKTMGSIEVPSRHDVLKVMDNCGCQIQNLSLYKLNKLPSMNTSKQRKYIQSLSLYGSTLISYGFLKSMTALTKVKICYYYPGQSPSDYPTTIALDGILGFFPRTLESLTIANVQVDFFGGPTYLQFPLKSLTLSFCQIDGRFEEFVTKALPQLDTLILERNSISTESESLILPNHHLSYLSIDPVYPDLDINILITTLDDRKTRLYCFNREVTFINNPKRSDPYSIYYYETVKPIPFEDGDTFMLSKSNMWRVFYNAIINKQVFSAYFMNSISFSFSDTDCYSGK
ncbi:hypothetical protein K501DRAFT_309843 [Backusella circina FSU 941]|nr:hypothetical protein K501DRAFT_309843 [Backusella circina FSU 941]